MFFIVLVSRGVSALLWLTLKSHKKQLLRFHFYKVISLVIKMSPCSSGEKTNKHSAVQGLKIHKFSRENVIYSFMLGQREYMMFLKALHNLFLGLGYVKTHTVITSNLKKKTRNQFLEACNFPFLLFFTLYQTQFHLSVV